MIKAAWKAFRIDKNGNLRFLFHTHNGSSFVPRDQWIETKKKWVSDGSRAKKKYRSGFHFFRSGDFEGIDRFNKLTRNKYFIVLVKVEKIRPKPNSSVKAWLAEKLYVPTNACCITNP